MKNYHFYTLLFCSILFACTPKLVKVEAVDEKEPEVQIIQPKETTFNYPATNKIDHIDTYHGIEVADPYRWLEDNTSEETADWVEAQNKVTFSYLDSIPFKKGLEERIKTLVDYEKISAPFKEGKYEYSYKNDGLQDHSIVYRTKIDSEDEPTIFLNPNEFSEDKTTGLRGMSFTDDGSLVAYRISEGGSDWRKAIVINTETMKQIGDTITDIKFGGIAWSGNEGFYYSSYDKPIDGSELSAKTQHHKLYYHKLGTPQTEDKLIYGGEKQPNRYISGYVTEDNKYLMLYASENTSGNQLYVRPIESDGEFTLLDGDYFTGISYLHNEGTTFYCSTNIDAPNYKVISMDINNPAPENWKTVIPETENVLRASACGGYLFAKYLIDAKAEVNQYNVKGELIRPIKLPAIGSAYGFWGKPTDKDFYYTFTSYLFPSTIYKYDIEKGTSELYKKPDIDFNSSLYETQQIFYTSEDGTKVPMFLTHKKGMELNGKNPTMLNGYGGFNASITPGFSASRLAWLEQGGIFAQPNLRGGGEYGKTWHKAGTLMNKQNVFDDFIAAAEWLIDNKYTSAGYLAIDGRSNGGLLVGAAMCQRPDLFKVALPGVGVMDMLRYHKFTAGAGWSADYGTADDNPEMFEYLKNYSPVHALKKGTAYPATLVTTADHDDRVVPAHSFKFAATLQEMHQGDNPVMIRVQTKAGHGSVSLSQQIALIADMYAFSWKNMDFEPEY